MSLLSFASGNSDMAKADALCAEGNFEGAIEIYEQIVDDGMESVSLYYNLGYAHYKCANIGKAILNFERARRLAPADEDILFNLDMCYQQTDKMQEAMPVFFEVMWNNFCHSVSSNGWAYIFVVLFVLTLVGVSLFFFSDSVLLRKTGFFSAIVALAIGVFALSMSVKLKNEITNGSGAIIMARAVNLQASPDKNGVVMVELHEGTYVDVLSQLGDWSEVRLKDGNVGWMLTSAIEKI